MRTEQQGDREADEHDREKPEVPRPVAAQRSPPGLEERPADRVLRGEMQRALWLLGHRRAQLWDMSQGAGQEITHSASRAWIRPMAIYQRRRQQAVLDYSHC